MSHGSAPRKPLLAVLPLALLLLCAIAILPHRPITTLLAVPETPAGGALSAAPAPIQVDAIPVTPRTLADSPMPTEHVLPEDAERNNKRLREEWIESMHWAAPGTDWRMIEEANREAYRLEREALFTRGVRTATWTELGSANLAGRTHAATVMPPENSLYVGSDNGGVWKGTLAGENWLAISDGLGRGSHAVVCVPGSPEVILTINAGGTVHASTNDGASWFVPSGLPGTMYECTRALRDQGSPRTVYVLSRSKDWAGDHWIYGWFLSRSDDGGVSFHTAHIELSYSPRCDIWTSRTTSGPLYLMAGEEIKASNDLGDSFVSVGSAPINSDPVIMTGSEAGNPTFYAALKPGSSWELYRSTDGGASWEHRYTIPDFWETLCASITNPDLVFFGGVECFRSVDGGASFTKLNEWWEYYGDPLNMLHADLPGMECRMIDGAEVWTIDTDGGTYVSYDQGLSVQNISLQGLGISQYYSTLTSTSDPYLVAAGAQDQGYQQSIPGQGTPYVNMIQLISGDYGHLTSTTRAHDYVYSVYPGFVLLQNNENEPYDLRQISFPGGSNHSWMPFILSDPVNYGIFYFTADYLWKYTRGPTGNYSIIRLPQNFAPGFLTGLAIAKSDNNYWYAITNLGKLWYSHNAGTTWTLSSTTGPGAHYFYGTALITSPTNRNIAYVGGSGYSGSAVYRTIDGGVTWQTYGTGLPSTLVFGLVFDNDTNQTLYAAAEAGPFKYDATAGAWVSILGTEAPLTTYWCVESVPELNAIRFGTYGRGIWDYVPVNPAGANDTAIGIGTEDESFGLFPNPARFHTTLQPRIERAGQVRIELFDITGRLVSVPLDAWLPAGRHSIRYDLTGDRGRPLDGGMYLVRMTAPEGIRVAKLRVVR